MAGKGRRKRQRPKPVSVASSSESKNITQKKLCRQAKALTDPKDGVETPGCNDVLCGRGPKVGEHNKNTKWRALIERNKIIYQERRLDQKRDIAKRIIQEVRGQSPPCRFLERHHDGLWYKIDEKKVCEKTMQALRDDSFSARRHVRNKAFHKRVAIEFPIIARAASISLGGTAFRGMSPLQASPEEPLSSCLGNDMLGGKFEGKAGVGVQIRDVRDPCPQPSIGPSLLPGMQRQVTAENVQHYYPATTEQNQLSEEYCVKDECKDISRADRNSSRAPKDNALALPGDQMPFVLGSVGGVVPCASEPQEWSMGRVPYTECERAPGSDERDCESPRDTTSFDFDNDDLSEIGSSPVARKDILNNAEFSELACYIAVDDEDQPNSVGLPMTRRSVTSGHTVGISDVDSVGRVLGSDAERPTSTILTALSTSAASFTVLHKGFREMLKDNHKRNLKVCQLSEELRKVKQSLIDLRTETNSLERACGILRRENIKLRKRLKRSDREAGRVRSRNGR